MYIQKLSLPEILMFTPRKFEDNRGFFMETFRQNILNDAVGYDVQFVQDNYSFSREKHTVRGLHYQKPPCAQGKLIKCTQGAILDVAVDVRVRSPTFGQSIQVELSAQNAKQLWIPVGFLHGFSTIQPNSVIQYKCTDYYVHELDGCVMWNDPDFNIDWGFDPASAVVSDKDTQAPLSKNFKSPFYY